MEEAEQQLLAVSNALSLEPGNADLIQLQQDLLLLIQLQQESANTTSTTTTSTSTTTTTARSATPSTAAAPSAAAVSGRYSEGERVRAPFDSSLHDAMVFESNSQGVRIIFAHPLKPSMQPCPFFLEGKCNREESKCKYSHGHYISDASLLRPYVQPDYSQLKEDDVVLAKRPEDRLWAQAKLVHIENHVAHVMFMQGKKGNIESLDIEDIVPLPHNEDDKSNNSDESVEDVEFAPKMLVSMASLESLNGSRLGAWETHTSGIGSRLMANMGYITGLGLGANNQGRVEPVNALVYPQGKSLDFCMRLREENKVKDVEKASKKKEYVDKEEERSNVFDFINNKLSKTKAVLPKSRDTSVKSGKSDGNKRRLEVHEALLKQSKEADRIRDAIKRNETRGDKATVMGLKVRLGELQSSLERLRRQEADLEKSKLDAAHKKKLVIF